MTFPQYAATQGVKSTDPLIDIIDCAVDHYEITRPHGLVGQEAAWYEDAYAYASKEAERFAT